MVRFSMMWTVWLGGVVYDLCVSSVGWFPERGISERLSSDFQVAWFIFAVWIIWMIKRRANRSPNELPRKP